MTTGTGRRTQADQIATRLKAFPGIQSVDLQKFPQEITISCDLAGARYLGVEGARVLVGDQIGDETSILVEMNGPAPQSRRARFDAVRVISPEPGKLQAQVTLEWQGHRFDGTGEDEASPAGELRCCATATIRAIEKIMGVGERFHLIGVKEIRIFDHDLIAVLMRSRELPQTQLVGTSVNNEDRRRAAAIAVLSATNRAVSKFVDGEDS